MRGTATTTFDARSLDAIEVRRVLLGKCSVSGVFRSRTRAHVFLCWVPRLCPPQVVYLGDNDLHAAAHCAALARAFPNVRTLSLINNLFDMTPVQQQNTGNGGAGVGGFGGSGGARALLPLRACVQLQRVALEGYNLSQFCIVFTLLDETRCARFFVHEAV